MSKKEICSAARGLGHKSKRHKAQMDFSLLFGWKAQPASHQHVPCREPQGEQPAQLPRQHQLSRGWGWVFFLLNPFLLLQGKQPQSQTDRRLSKHQITSPASVNWHSFHQTHRGGGQFSSLLSEVFHTQQGLNFGSKHMGCGIKCRLFPKPL